MVHRALVAVAASGLMAASLAGGVEIRFETKIMKKDEAVFTGRMEISGLRVAMQINADENSNTMIFRGDKELMWAVDHAQKQYSEITKESMAQMGQTVSAAMEQMKAQMENMPPEQRAMIEKMMQGQMGAAAHEKPEPVTLKKTAEWKTVGKYSCVKYEVLQGKEKNRDLWMTDWKNIKELKETTPAFESMGAFFKSMVEAFKDVPAMQKIDNPYSYASEVNGFPIMTVEYDKGVPVYQTTFTSIGQKTVPESAFNPPAGYTRNSAGFGQQPPKRKKGTGGTR